jgi:hypothetical protein
MVEPIVRDFIYFDSERMESYLAQIEKGLRQEESETTSFEKEVGGKLSGGITAIIGAELGAGGTHTRQYQVSKRLHSYLYQLLEDGLAKRVHLISNYSADEWRSGKVQQSLIGHETDFVKVVGRVKIVDFGNLATSLESMLKLMELFTIWESTSQQQRSVASSGKRTRRRRQEMQMEGADQVEQIVALVREFYSDVILVKVFPLDGMSQYYCVGPLDQDNLQDDRTRLLLKYGSSPSVPWTVFGQLASVPREMRETETIRPLDLSGILPQSFDSLADAVETMLDALTMVFAQSGLSVTVRYPAISITPLAIYRE